ncbi:hypothetical protein LSTR_LSTR002171 [Laodelphax striatellus]|uniref:Uncharacterized protein n=1 Tax=Laodelphax striatellus TaxID=195883 RepID=A0A482XPP1_LAOST|nr:hypothetical protein LSTR_LSTR002171 [Laodelphax striatellus]
MKTLCISLIIFGQVHLQTSSSLASEILPNNAVQATYDAHYFDQKLDHFDKSNNKTWKQRYYYYSELYDQAKKIYPSIPLFLIISGERSVNYGTQTNNSPMYHLGRDYNALMMQLEHRYYGESRPTPNITVENLKYLSSQQALEDIIYFVDKMKKKFGMKCNNEVVVFGGSYAGALAAWVRLKHPDKISVAQASSAPIANIYDFAGYNNVVRNSIKLYDENCASIIHEGSVKEEELTKTEEGLKNMTDKFKTCRSLTNKNDRRAFFQNQIDKIGYTVQYNGTLNQSIPATCKLLTGGNETDSIDKLANYLIETSGGCTGYDYSDNIKDLRQTDYTNQNQFRQFLWQECTQLGLFITSGTKDSFYANTLGVDFYTDRCKDVFGDKFTAEYIKKQVKKTNAYYGGFNYQQSKCLFTQGQLDPYQAAGIKESNDKIGYKALIIENVGHTRDLNTETKDDPPQLVKAREEIKQILKGWIKAVDFSKQPTNVPSKCQKPQKQ